MNVKLLTEHHLGFLSLKGGRTSLSESTIVKIPHCLNNHTSWLNYQFIICYPMTDFSLKCTSTKDHLYTNFKLSTVLTTLLKWLNWCDVISSHMLNSLPLAASSCKQLLVFTSRNDVLYKLCAVSFLDPSSLAITTTVWPESIAEVIFKNNFANN